MSCGQVKNSLIIYFFLTRTSYLVTGQVKILMYLPGGQVKIFRFFYPCYGDIHFKDLLGKIARAGYCIPAPNIYLVLHGLRCQKNTLKDYSLKICVNVDLTLLFNKEK